MKPSSPLRGGATAPRFLALLLASTAATATVAVLAACGSSNSSANGTDAGATDGTVAEGGYTPPLLNDSGMVTSGGDSGPCKNLQCDIASCSGGGSTTISGRILDPAGHNPLNGVVVYVPNTTLNALPAGASCDTCSSLFSGDPVASAITGPDGKYSITFAPNGSQIPLVVQVGKWRKQTNAATVAPCTDNPQPDIKLPSKSSEGDLPNIAVSTGALDSLECLLQRIGIDPSEFVAGNGGSGHVHYFLGGQPGSQGDTQGLCGVPNAGTSVGGSENGVGTSEPASYQALWDTTAHLMAYDIVLLSCEGGETYMPNLQALHDYTSGGGRVFASHFHYAWFNAGPFASENVADWQAGECTGSGNPVNGTVVTSLPNGMPYAKGAAFNQWLGNVGALTGGKLPVYSAKDNGKLGSTNTVSQSWIAAGANDPGVSLYFSFDTPTNAVAPSDGGPPPYCGRVVYSGLHVAGAPSTQDDRDAGAPPAGCAQTALSAQEDALEFMLFDLSSCVTVDSAPPTNPIPIK